MTPQGYPFPTKHLSLAAEIGAVLSRSLPETPTAMSAIISALELGEDGRRGEVNYLGFASDGVQSWKAAYFIGLMTVLYPL